MKRKRRIGALTGILLIFSCFSALFCGEETAVAAKKEGFPAEKSGVRPAEVPAAKMRIILRCDYADGDRSETVVEEKGPFHRWLGDYRGWDLSDMGTDHMILTKKMGGHSPLHFSFPGKGRDLFQGLSELFNHPPFLQFDPEWLEAKEGREDPAGSGKTAVRQG